MELRVSYNSGNFLTNWEAISFSGLCSMVLTSVHAPRKDMDKTGKPIVMRILINLLAINYTKIYLRSRNVTFMWRQSVRSICKQKSMVWCNSFDLSATSVSTAQQTLKYAPTKKLAIAHSGNQAVAHIDDHRPSRHSPDPFPKPLTCSLLSTRICLQNLWKQGQMELYGTMRHEIPADSLNKNILQNPILTISRPPPPPQKLERKKFAQAADMSSLWMNRGRYRSTHSAPGRRVSGGFTCVNETAFWYSSHALQSISSEINTPSAHHLSNYSVNALCCVSSLCAVLKWRHLPTAGNTFFAKHTDWCKTRALLEPARSSTATHLSSTNSTD